MPTALVIDAGGSRTRFYLVDSEGDKPELVERAGFNWHRDDLRKLQTTCQELGARPSTVIAFIAGLLDEDAKQQAERLLLELWRDARVEAWPDYVAPLHQAEKGSVALVAGTGCVVASKSEEGYAKTGGWGPLIGDFGSGFALGRRGLWSYACENWQNEKFSGGLVDIFGTEDLSSVMAAAAKPDNVFRVAGLARVMLELASGGDNLATDAVRRIAADQARLIEAHCDRLNLPKTGELVLYGSLVTLSITMREFLEQELKRHGFSFSFTMLTEEQMLSGVASYALKRDRL